jgi:outer membrane protein assembly factor BamB
MNQDTERSYIAFISYRHRPLDKQAAEMIQRKIENYKVPREFRDRAGGDRLGMVFRDEDELPASSSLSNSITYALDHTKYLLVICTPDLPESKWCEQEIRYFLKTHDRDHVLAVLVDGEPEVSFSPYLLHTYDENGNITGDTEPLAANIAGPDRTIDKKAFRKEIVRIYAALLGCPFDALWQRQKRARANRLLALLGIVMAAMTVFLGVVLSKNAQIARQNASLQRQMSAMHVDTGRTRLENYDVDGALQSGIDALLGDPSGDLYDHRAEKLLSDASYAYEGPDWRSRLLYSQPTAIETLALTPDGTVCVFSDEAFTVRAVDTTSGSLLWEYAAETERSSYDASPAEVFAFQDLVVCKYADRVIARSPGDGRELWRFAYEGYGGNHFRAFNSTGSRMMLLDQPEGMDSPVYMIVLDTADGKEIGRAAVSGGKDTANLSSSDPWYSLSGGFSENDRYGAVAIYVTHQKDDGTDGGKDGTLKMALYDLENFSEVYSLYTDEYHNLSTIIYGICPSDKGDMTCARYLSSYGGVIISQISGDTQSGRQTLVNQSISTQSGSIVDLIGEYLHALPMLVHDNLALVASESSLFLFDLGTEPRLAKELSYPGRILSCGWTDRAADQVYAWNASGSSSWYDLNQDGTTDSLVSSSYDQNDIAHLCPVYDEEGNFRFGISVMNSRPGNILIMENTCDPSGEVLSAPPQDMLMDNYQIEASPSGDTVYIRYKEKDSDLRTVAAYDAITHEKLSSAEFEMDYFNDTIFAMDQESFLLGKYICRLDGSRDYYLEKINDDNAYEFTDSYFRHTVLSDGRVMSVFDCCAAGKDVLVPVWIDGKLVASSSETAAGISFSSGKILETGRNGLVAGFGIHRYMKDDETMVTAETDGFMVFDAVNEKRIVFGDQHPEARDRMIAVGNKEPVFACADDLGHICLYNTEDASAADLATGYGIREIKALTFSPDDRFLLVITRNGSLDCFDLEEGTFVYSEQPDVFNTYRYPYVDRLACMAGADDRYLYLKAYDSDDPYGQWLSLDQTSWTLAASSDLVYAALPADGCLYKWHEHTLYRYPIHSLEDLAAAALEKTGQEVQADEAE